MARSLAVVLAGLWAGSLCTIGYVVAPALFSLLEERALAGDIAGRLFHLQALLSLGFGVALVLCLRAHRGLCGLVVGIVALQLIGEYALGPWLAHVRTSSGPSSTMFVALHGVAAGLYLTASLLAVWLAFRLARGRGA